MEYIILDLEWDNIYFLPEKRFINQILQIGAVKLNDKFEVVDTFEATVRSAISDKVSSRFTSLTGITKEKMLSGVPLKDAVDSYNRFARSADVTMTWSTTDLYTIAENQKTLLKDEVKFELKNYLDLQKLVQLEMNSRGFDTKNQIALESAATLFGVDTLRFQLHTALDDSRLCAELLKICYKKEYFDLIVKDATAPDFYARLEFKAYPITDINDNDINKKDLEFDCPKCAKKANRIRKWKYRNRWFTAIFKCTACGHKFMGRVSFKKTFDNVRVKRRTTELKIKDAKNGMQSMPETVQLDKN